MEVYAYEPVGYEGCLVRIEVDIRRGIPAIDIVGLAAAAVRESRERVRAAIRNSGFEFPQDRVLINLSPADLPKEGASYDLPIAVKILSASGAIPECGRDLLVVGELTLDGRIHPVRAVLPAFIQARGQGISHFIVPAESLGELGKFAGGDVYPIQCVADLPEIMLEIRDGVPHKPKTSISFGSGSSGAPYVDDAAGRSCAGYPARRVGGDREDTPRRVHTPDFSDYCGNETLMRALVVAAAGRHNLLLFGPPGSGKTAAAMRFPSLMPPLTEHEAVEVGVVWSLYGKRPGWSVGAESASAAKSGQSDTGVDASSGHHEGFSPLNDLSFDATGPESGFLWPPVRAPHHSASSEGMVGGGRPLRPGEISLAHKGLLFLDETTEFRRDVLQSLREPMEKGFVTIVRAGRTVYYPADFQLLMAANPCPCGNLGSSVRTCVCSPQEIQRYWKKLGGPLLDRVDMRIPVHAPTPDELLSPEPGRQGRLQEAVERAVAVQRQRAAAYGTSGVSGLFGTSDGLRNGRLNVEQVSRVCPLTQDARSLLVERAQELALSARACQSILKIARTIGDIDGKETIDVSSIEEAVGYRQFGDGEVYWPF